MTRGTRVGRGASVLGLVALMASEVPCAGPAVAAELTYPQLIRIRYEPLDPKQGGQLVVWVEREKIWYGLDPRLYPAVRYVEVTHVTPAPGTPMLTIIEVATLTAKTPEYFHLSGNVRFRVSGMVVKSTNAPPPSPAPATP